MRDDMKIGEVSAQMFLRGPGVTDPTLDPKPALIGALAAAKASINGIVFSITLPDVAQALIAAHQRNIPVRLVVDATEAKYKSSQVPALVAAGLDIRAWGGNYREAHDKLVVIDGRTLITGSYNWSTLAEVDNMENMFILAGSRITTKVLPPLMAKWNAAYAQGVKVGA